MCHNVGGQTLGNESVYTGPGNPVQSIVACLSGIPPLLPGMCGLEVNLTLYPLSLEPSLGSLCPALHTMAAEVLQLEWVGFPTLVSSGSHNGGEDRVC